MNAPNNSPLGKEIIEPQEQESIETIAKMSADNLKSVDHPPAYRQVHSKPHGCVWGQLMVDSDIPETLKHGIFKSPDIFDIWVRFSNGNPPDQNGHFKPDTEGDIRGMAIKLVNVPGEKILDDPNHAKEQDFLLMSSPIFFIKNVEDYITFFKVGNRVRAGEINLQTEEVPEHLKAQFEQVAYAFKIFDQIGESPTHSPLDRTYWSATPYQLGPHVIKMLAEPHFNTEPFNPKNATDKDNYLKEAMKVHLDQKDAYFDLKVQLQTNPETMPIEDPTIEWNEAESSYIKVATLRIPRQAFDFQARKEFNENLSFSPWYCLPEHQPLGGVNRTRKTVYKELSKLRHELNQISK